jgi:hypothetical protein
MPGYLPPSGINPFPVSGLDWADGSVARFGTPTPAGAKLIHTSPYNAPNAFLEELPDSPEIDIGDIVTITHRFRCDWDTAAIMSQGIQRQSLMVDSNGILTSVLNVSVHRMTGNTAQLSITAEAVLDPPIDEFQVTPVEFNLALEKHPRYRSVLMYNLDSDGQIQDDESPTGYEIIQNVKLSANSPQLVYRTGNLLWLNEDNIPGFDDTGATDIPGKTLGDLIYELLDRFWRGENEFYLAGWQVHYSWYYYGLGQLAGQVPQVLYPLDEGGYIQDPVVSGFLPAYFWSLNGSHDTSPLNNMLQRLPYLDSNSLYHDPKNGMFRWLRQADDVQFSRTWFKQTLTWVGAPLGTWDALIYPVWNGSGLSWSSSTP